ncbi:HAD hydrolase-like protein [Paenibacillus sp. N1-5-1-14]|uniref:HAD family hydrolase n=1 Tax=Paenibacillus radicibacter TaxID=2972488 RepID=UPI0021594F2B|nr:HAD hydrolase-like protein [Paenibacillus radicibacter]MCR8643692.1 HAD hydrolase-like protein [Paenibacillus radicibacter]
MQNSHHEVPEAMIFDLDGTLFQTETLLVKAYHKLFDTLRSEGLFEGPTPPEERMLSCLGMVMETIWDKVMPDASIEAHERANELLSRYELEGLAAGDGKLYDEVEVTLKELRSRGIKLFVASNGQEPYVRGVAAAKGITDLFVDLYSAGEYQTTTKVDLVAHLLNKYQLKSAWMVGDRSSDVEAGLENGLTVVACDYATFRSAGELEGAHIRIKEFKEILNYIEQ